MGEVKEEGRSGTSGRFNLRVDGGCGVVEVVHERE